MSCTVKPCNKHAVCPNNVRPFCDTLVADDASLYYNRNSSITINCDTGSTYTYFIPDASIYTPFNQSMTDRLAGIYTELLQSSLTLMCLEDLEMNATEGHYFTFTLTVTGGTPVSWTIVSGAIPTGMSFSGGIISGVPEASGIYTFTVKATDADGNYTEMEYTMEVVETAPLMLEDGSYLLLEDGGYLLLE